ncbi:PEGA domain-containing protein [Myxococcota bacterium]
MVFDKYQVIRRVAVGGMGEIFLARQTGVAGFDRLVILKSLLPELAEQPGFIDQFLDEARVAATLNHPNIVSIYEVGAWRGVYFIAMEYIRGENLGRLLQAVTTADIAMPLIVAVRVVRDAALALDHAHHATNTLGNPLNIVHRDIGLQNIMVRVDGVAKVVDFGIARAANRSTRTATGLVKGKLQYMSPEQIRGEELDARTDQFSLGVVLWEMSTRRRLFKAEHDLATIQRITGQPIQSPSTVVDDYPKDLETVTMRMLERDRGRRFERCNDVAEALEAVMAGMDGADAQQRVATFIEQVLGEKLADLTRDLTPSTETPFTPAWSLPALAGGEDVTIPIEVSGKPPPRRGRWGFLAAVVGAVVGLGVMAKLELVDVPGLTTSGPRLDIRKPVGARVLVDGEVWKGTVPTVVTGLAPGQHHVSLELPNLPALKKQVVLGADERLVIEVPPPAEGMVLDIRRPVGARVVLDGKRWNEPVPTVVTGLSPGAHRVRLVLPNGGVLQKRVKLEPGAPILIQEPPPAEGMVIDIRDPEGAIVMIDGAPWTERVPTVVTGLAVGQHHVELRLPGLPTLKKQVELTVGEPVLIQEPPPAAGPAIDIREPRGARVIIDGRPWKEKVPTVVEPVEPGHHVVQLERKGQRPIVKKVRVETGVSVVLQDLPAAAPPSLTVRSKPSAAYVRVGGRKLGKTPTRIESLEPGVEHAVVLEKRGYQPMTVTITLEPGETRNLQVPLTRVGRTPPPDPIGPKPNGFLTLKTTPWVKISIDGKPFGSTPLYKVELSPGKHSLHLVNEQFNIDTKRNITITSTQTNKVNLNLR